MWSRTRFHVFFISMILDFVLKNNSASNFVVLTYSRSIETLININPIIIQLQLADNTVYTSSFLKFLCRKGKMKKYPHRVSKIGGCQKNIYDLNDENNRRHVNNCRENDAHTKERKGQQPLIMKFLHKPPKRDETKEFSSSNNLDENENESSSNLLPSHEDNRSSGYFEGYR